MVNRLKSSLYSINLLIFVLAIAVSSTPQPVEAQVTNSLIRQPRTMAMGGAGIALADDEYALFQNPAGLAGQESRRFRLLGLTLEASQDTYATFGTSLSAFSNFKLSTLNTLMGKDIFIRVGVVPMITLPHFAIAYLADVQGSINQFNQANPSFLFGDRITHGVQAGMGWSLPKGRHANEEVRFGAAAKVLWRKGGYYEISTAGFLQATSSSKSYIDNLVGNFGVGYGVDFGTQYINKLDKKTSLFAGASATDIGGTKFSDSHAQAIPMNLGFGVGAKKQLDAFTLKVDADLRNLTQETAFVNKTHFGTELSMSLLDFYFGLNQMNLTFGASFDLWILRVSAVSDAEELGINFHQQPSRRYMVQVDFNLPI